MLVRKFGALFFRLEMMKLTEYFWLLPV